MLALTVTSIGSGCVELMLSAAAQPDIVRWCEASSVLQKTHCAEL